MTPTQVHFSKRAVKLIEKYSKPYARQTRVKKLGKILRHWSRAELAEHLSPKPSTHAQNARNKQLQKVGQHAQKLLETMQALDNNGRDLIAYMMAVADTKTSIGKQHTAFMQFIKRIDDECHFLERLSAATHKAVHKHTGRNITAYLVMLDAAAIYKWLTGTQPSRIVVDGTETGPFYIFLSCLWPVIFQKGDAGLPAAIKNWARYHREYGESSPLIANIAIRHPEWRVFEQ